MGNLICDWFSCLGELSATNCLAALAVCLCLHFSSNLPSARRFYCCFRGTCLSGMHPGGKLKIWGIPSGATSFLLGKLCLQKWQWFSKKHREIDLNRICKVFRRRFQFSVERVLREGGRISFLNGFHQHACADEESLDALIKILFLPGCIRKR